MKCFLHIGTEKTATTTIQRFFQLNRVKFADYGFLLPESVGSPNNYKLPLLTYNYDRIDDLTQRCDIYTNKDLRKFQKRTVKSLKKEIARNKRKTIIFSSEHIQSRLTSLQEITHLKSVLEHIGIDDIFVIVYLRDPIEIASSLFSNCIINGYSIEVPPSPEDSYFNSICNHKNTLIKFERVFGREHLIPRLFDGSEFKNGSIIEDFLDIIGLPLLDDFRIPNSQNTSFSPLGLELLRRINKKVPLFIDDKINPLRSNIVEYFQNNFNDSKYVLSKHLFDEYQDAFKESNEWVRKNWFPEKKSLFSETVCTDKTTVQITDAQLNQITNLLTDIWVNKQ